MNQVSHICPISDDEAARAVSSAAFADLAERIMAVPVSGAGERPHRSRRRRRRWLAPVALAGALAAALLLVSSLGNSGTGLGPSNAAALSFTRHGGFIDVIVRNPLADPARYRAEFAAHSLDIKLTLVPASPSLVGSLVGFSASEGSGAIKPITAVGKCWADRGANVCPVGVRVPLGYRGTADLGFGRAARPGEHYEAARFATAPGEVMHGVHLRGLTVARVLSILHARHVTVPQYRRQIGNFSHALTLLQVPKTWHVFDATPWAPGQVLLWVGPS